MVASAHSDDVATLSYAQRTIVDFAYVNPHYACAIAFLYAADIGLYVCLAYSHIEILGLGPLAIEHEDHRGRLGSSGSSSCFMCATIGPSNSFSADTSSTSLPF